MPDQFLFPPAMDSVQRAFSKQAEHYDRDDEVNQILIDWRTQVYHHVNVFIKRSSQVLELNAGTGIDALHFVRDGHNVHATDAAPGMIEKIQQKIKTLGLERNWSTDLCSFESLGSIQDKKFDYVFSNFGGLNCSKDLSLITRHLPALLNKGAFVTWVIMPPIAWWELLRVLKGKSSAFRRFKKNGALSHLEGEYFKIYYYSLNDLKNAFGKNFKLLKVEGLGVVTPPPSALIFTRKNPIINSLLIRIDRFIRNTFPFNRTGDHIIATFQFMGYEDQR